MCYTCDVTRWQDGGWFCSDATSKFEGKIRLLLLNVQKSFIHQILSFDLNIYLSKKKRGLKIRCSNTLIVQTIYLTLVLCFNPESFLRASLPFSSIYLFWGFSRGSCSLVAVVLVFVFAFSEVFSQCSLFMICRHIFEISDDSRMRITLNDLPTSKSKTEDDFHFTLPLSCIEIALSGCT